MPLTVKIHVHAPAGKTFAGERVLDGERVTIGRSKECTLCLDDPEKYLSRIHAELDAGEDGYLLKAVSKHSPVLLNGKALAIDSVVQVGPGDTLTMDIYDIEITGTGAPEDDPDSTTIVREADPEATMIFGGLSRSPSAYQAAAKAAPAAAAAAPAALAAGTVIAGRYRVEATLVASGMGTVYRAHDQTHARDLALRALPPELLAAGPARQRFEQEARIAIGLKHPHIVVTHEIVTEADQVFLSMELLAGQTLRAAMEERSRTGRKWSEAEVLAIIRPLCEALTYAHLVTVHRDIRPENVWLSASGPVKLMDFGLAPGLPEGQFTRSAPVAGAAGYYLAPEQLARTGELDHRADQYSLGVMVYELLAGRIPAGRIESLSTLRADVSGGLSLAVDKALSADATGRFGSAAQFLIALRMPKAAAAPAVAPVVAPSAKPPRRPLVPLALGIAALAGVLVLGWPLLQGILPASEAQKQQEQKIARLDGEAKALLKMIENDQRELKEAVLSANRDVERIAGQLRAAPTRVERASLDLAVREARNTARLAAALESKLREQTDGPAGLPKSAGTLSAAAAVAKGADKAGAIKLLEEAVGTLSLLRTGITEDRKAALTAYQRRQEELRSAEAQAIKEEETRMRAEAVAESEARARAAAVARARAESAARAKAAELAAMAESEARAKVEAEARARAESDARAR